MKMRYLSLFSGIEAASLAWKPLGWECVGVAEIEPFACAVLAHHYPDVPNLGSVTEVTEEQIKALGHIDLVVYGFPCQDLSVAGKRKGLKDADGNVTRSGLFWTAAKIIGWAGARWSIAENVPGLLSSNEGLDYASVVSELCGREVPVPGNGWRNAGIAHGGQGLVEWGILDAQYCRTQMFPRAVPQRRRRIFIVRDSGNWQGRPPIFLEQESLRRNPPPCRETGEGTARDAKGGTGSLCAADGSHGAGSQYVEEGKVIPWMGSDQVNAEFCHGIAGTLNCNKGQRGGIIPVESTDRIKVRFASDCEPCPTISSVHHHAVCYGIDEECNATKDVYGTLLKGGQGGTRQTVCFEPGILKREGAENRVNDEVCSTLRSEMGDNQPAVAFNSDQSEKTRSMGESSEACPTLRSGGVVSVATPMQVRRLTPTECERLQGFPDNFTRIPYRGKPADKCPDGPRYKALGNSMAVNVMNFLGEKIDKLEGEG